MTAQDVVVQDAIAQGATAQDVIVQDVIVQDETVQEAKGEFLLIPCLKIVFPILSYFWPLFVLFAIQAALMLTTANQRFSQR